MSVDGEHIAQWAVRAEVIHHFYAYVQFDKSSDCIDMVNLDNTDIESFNRHSHMYPGLATEHKLAEYLKTFELLDKTSCGLPNTHRTRFLRHVVEYNETQAPRRRFYLLNLTAADLEYLADFNMWPGRTYGDDYRKKLIWASTCVESIAESLIAPKIISDVDQIESAIQKAIKNHQEKRASPMANDTETRVANGASSNNTNRLSRSILANGIHKDFCLEK